MFMLNITSGFILMNNLFKGASEKGTEPGVLTDRWPVCGAERGLREPCEHRPGRALRPVLSVGVLSDCTSGCGTAQAVAGERLRLLLFCQHLAWAIRVINNHQ